MQGARLAVVTAVLTCFVNLAAAQAAAPISAEDLARIVDLDALSASTDGKWLAFQRRQASPRTNTYDQAWYVMPTGGGTPRKIADGGEPILFGEGGVPLYGIRQPTPKWSRDNRWLFYLRREHARTQVWRARLDGGVAEQVTRHERDVRSFSLSVDGRKLIFTADRDFEPLLKREGANGFLFDDRFMPALGSTPTRPAKQDTAAEAGASDLAEAAVDYLVLDLRSRNKRRATADEIAEFERRLTEQRPEGRPFFRELASRSASGTRMAWLEARNPEQQGGMAPVTLVAEDARGTAAIVCSAPECTGQRIRALWWRNDDEVLFARGEGLLFQETALYGWRPEQPTPRLIVRTSSQFASNNAWTCPVAFDRLYCFHEESDRPRTLVAIDLASGAVSTLFEPNPDFASSISGMTVRPLRLEAPSTGENLGYLVLPSSHRAGERLPLVIVTYRCSGFLRGGVGDEYPIFPLAAEGFAVLCFNTPDVDVKRLATSSFEEFEDWARGPGDQEKRRVQQGLDAAVEQLSVLGVIDSRRIGVTGLSFGAETVNYAMFSMPSLTSAIASGTGFEPSTTWLFNPAAVARMARWELESPTSSRWASISLALNATRVQAPLLLNVPDQEFLPALEPVAALKAANRSVEMFVFPNEHHIKWQAAHRLAIYNRNIDWMNFWLRGVESNLMNDPAQYKRWRAMRENQCKLFGPNGTERGPAGPSPWYCAPGAIQSGAVAP